MARLLACRLCRLMRCLLVLISILVVSRWRLTCLLMYILLTRVNSLLLPMNLILRRVRVGWVRLIANMCRTFLVPMCRLGRGRCWIWFSIVRMLLCRLPDMVRWWLRLVMTISIRPYFLLGRLHMGLLNLNRALYNFVYVVVNGLIGCMGIRLIRRLEVPGGKRRVFLDEAV